MELRLTRVLCYYSLIDFIYIRHNFLLLELSSFLKNDNRAPPISAEPLCSLRIVEIIAS